MGESQQMADGVIIDPNVAIVKLGRNRLIFVDGVLCFVIRDSTGYFFADYVSPELRACVAHLFDGAAITGLSGITFGLAAANFMTYYLRPEADCNAD